ncbi:MAG TPA: ATPase, partial [Gordonia polyisoprenivorans]|nr:ATPase [Gordonia polyisoprenivorans]
GASPRATLGIVAAARALALVRGRDYVIPQDIVEIIPDVLRHRLVLSYDAMADEITADTVITRILQTVGLPQVGAQPMAAPYPSNQQQPSNQQPGLQQTGPQQPGQDHPNPPASPVGAPPSVGQQITAQPGQHAPNQATAHYGGQ